MARAAAVVIDRPTDEQQRRAIYHLGPVRTERGQVVGKAYFRVPLFERLAKGENGIGVHELETLRRYRAAHDRNERSPTRSCLNVFPDLDEPTPEEREARERARAMVRRCEAFLGMATHTMRAVALKDQTFFEIALDRYGTRKRPWVFVDKKGRKKGEHLELIEPAGQHPVDTIKAEFAWALRRMTMTLYPDRYGDTEPSS